jgi:hypothetical protein
MMEKKSHHRKKILYFSILSVRFSFEGLFTAIIRSPQYKNQKVPSKTGTRFYSHAFVGKILIPLSPMGA